jgi:hypothetical protein
MGPVMIGGGHITTFEVSPVDDVSRRALHIRHLVSIRSMLSNPPERVRRTGL